MPPSLTLFQTSPPNTTTQLNVAFVFEEVEEVPEQRLNDSFWFAVLHDLVYPIATAAPRVLFE